MLKKRLACLLGIFVVVASIGCTRNGERYDYGRGILGGETLMQFHQRHDRMEREGSVK